MKNYLGAVLILLLACLYAHAKSSDPRAISAKRVTPYPALPGAVASSAYAVKADGQKIFTEVISRFDVPVHYARFTYEADKEISIEITIGKAIDTFTVSPRSANIQAVKKDKKLLLTIREARYLVLNINDLGYLFLLIDMPEERPLQPGMSGVKNIMEYKPDITGGELSTAKIQKAIDELAASGDPATLYFPAGLYRTGTLHMKSNVSLYLAPGALIKASSEVKDIGADSCLIRLDHVSNMKITGRGCIDGSGWDGLRMHFAKKVYLLFASDCHDLIIDGPLLRDPCYWTVRVFRSTGITLRNVKLINNRPAHNWCNTDGIDIDSSTDCLVLNAIMHTGDDTVVVKGLDTDNKHPSERIRFEKIVGISNSAAVKIGTETSVPVFRNIIFSDIDVVRCKRGIVISGFDSTTIEQVQVLDMRIESIDYEGTEATRVIDIEVSDSSFRISRGMVVIKSILIKNLKLFFPVADAPSRIAGRTEKFGITDVVLVNFNVEGKQLLNTIDANMKTNDFVTNMRFRKE
jgi:polygalacturonase